MQLYNTKRLSIVRNGKKVDTFLDNLLSKNEMGNYSDYFFSTAE